METMRERQVEVVRRRLHDRNGSARIGGISLVLAGLLVAVAISTDGTLSRGINGIGALVWMASTAALLLGVQGGPRWRTRLGLATVVTVILSLGVEPTNLATAVPGFALGGAAIAIVSPRPVAWALLVPALWLPVHLLTAVLPAILRAANGGEASVRTDPPPTAAIVPLMMILSAGGAGWLVARFRHRRDGHERVATASR